MMMTFSLPFLQVKQEHATVAAQAPPVPTLATPRVEVFYKEFQTALVNGM